MHYVVCTSNYIKIWETGKHLNAEIGTSMHICSHLEKAAKLITIYTYVE